jgi:hypothetical protein
LEDRWSSIATIIARITRSGTLVGPGTNRKLRPGILGIGMVSSSDAGQEAFPDIRKWCTELTNSGSPLILH